MLAGMYSCASEQKLSQDGLQRGYLFAALVVWFGGLEDSSTRCGLEGSQVLGTQNVLRTC